ncbi:MAG: large subunit ribosomal protein [Actinomycetota bacterium]|nr:large subunit ribosomal protein [Actinomycetota bacterium]
MKLILTQEVSGLGEPGDVVEVKDGYGRNFLMPRGLAASWTKGAEKQIAAIRRARTSREFKSLEEAQQVRASLESGQISLSAKAGSSGRLFGAVTPSDIAQAVSAGGGPALDRRKIEMPQAIKSVGEYVVSVRLHPEVQVRLKIKVTASA